METAFGLLKHAFKKKLPPNDQSILSIETIGRSCVIKMHDVVVQSSVGCIHGHVGIACAYGGTK
jgi:hypothetical protein